MKSRFVSQQFHVIISCFWLCFCALPFICHAQYYDISQKPTMAVADSVSGHTFHVRTDGADDMVCNGLYDAPASAAPNCAFLTIRFATQTLSPRTNDPVSGDVIKIHAGIYHESFTPAVAGLTIGPAGDGEVIVDSSDQVTWTQYSGNIYVADWSSYSAHAVRALVVDGENYFPVASGQGKDDVTPGYYYYDSNNYLLYTSVKTDLDDPDNHDVVVIRNYTTGSPTITVSKSNTTIYGITVRGSGGKGIYISGSSGVAANNVTIEQCDIKENGFSGIGINYSIPNTGLLIKRNWVHNNMLHNWPRSRGGYWSGGWGKGIDSLATDTPTITENIVNDNGGEGIGVVRGTGGEVADNKVYDNWSVGLYFNQQNTFTAERNIIYSTGVDLSDMTNNGYTPGDSEYTAGARRLRQIGISTGDEDAVAYTGGTIKNNIIVDCRYGIAHVADQTGSGVKNTVVANNTIILPDTDEYDASTVSPHMNHYYGISYSNTGYNTNSVVENNIICGRHPGTKLVRWQWYKTDNDQGITWNNNVYYHSSTEAPMYFKGSWYSFKDWQNISGQDKNSINSDPLFVGTVGGFSRSDYFLSFTSPAKGAGAVKYPTSLRFRTNP